MLGLRMQQLGEVERLALSLKVAGDVGYTCETAAHFYLFHVLARW
jgi:intron-binding protein aquarius